MKLATIAGLRRSGPQELSRLLRGELDWIVMKCLEKEPGRRYDTASALLDDVRRYLNDEEVQACPPSAGYRFCKFARRNKGALAMTSVIGAAVLAAVAALATSTVLVARALDAETAVKVDLKVALERERQDSYFHRIALADRELGANNLGRALQLLNECPADLRQWEWHYLSRSCRMDPVILPVGTEVNSISFSPDGQQLASACGDGLIRIWHPVSLQPVRTFPAHPGFASCVAFHPDGRHLASVGADRQAHVWDLESEQSVFSRPCDAVHVYGTAHAVSFSPDGRYLAAGQDGIVGIWDWQDGRLVESFAGHEKRQISVAFSDAGKLATGSWWGTVKMWDADAGSDAPMVFEGSLETHHPVSVLAFAPAGSQLAAATYDRRVDVWETQTGKHIKSLPHAGLVLCVAYSPDGRRLASAGEDKTVKIWDAASGREVLNLRGHTGLCGCLAFSPDGRRLASASRDKTIRVWDANSLLGHEGQELLTITAHEHEIWSLNISPDGRRVVSGGFSTPTKVWDLSTGKVSIDVACHRDIDFCVAWQPDSRRVASAGADGAMFSVKVWDAQTGVEAFTLPNIAPGRPEFFAVAFSPDGRFLVTGSANKSLEVWDARTGAAIGTLGTHDRVIRGVAFSRDGQHLASMSDEGTVKFWDATRLNESQTASGSVPARIHGQCQNLAFSPDGQRLATGGVENTVKIWDVQTRAELRALRGHSGDIYTVAFSPDPDGRWIASAGEDSTVKLWDSRSGEQVHSFRGHVGLVSSLAFTPDGRKVVSGSRDHTVKVWDVSPFCDLEDR